MLRHSIPKKTRSAVACAILTSLLFSCTSAPFGARGIASDPTPLNEEQFKNIADLGVGILRLTILSNSIDRENKIDDQMNEAFKKIEKERKESVNNVAAISMGVGGMGLFLTLMLDSMDLSITSIDATSNAVTSLLTGEDRVPLGGNRSMYTSGYTLGGSLILTGAVIGIANSAGSNSLQNIGSDKKEAAKTSGAREQAELQAEVRRQINALTKLYSTIFNLSPEANVVFKEKVREEIAAKTKATAGTNQKVTIDFPLLLASQKIISQADYAQFRSELNQIEIAAASKASVSGVVKGENYATNVDRLKTILRAYVAWIKDAEPSLRSAEARTSANRAVDDAERLLMRI